MRRYRAWTFAEDVFGGLGKGLPCLLEGFLYVWKTAGHATVARGSAMRYNVFADERLLEPSDFIVYGGRLVRCIGRRPKGVIAIGESVFTAVAQSGA